MTVCIFVSDLHTRDIDPPPGDILINCGDNTFRGKANEVNWLKGWLKKQRPKYKEVIWINGNHDFNGEYWGPEVAKETDTIYLENSGCEVLGLKIWGTPYTPTFFNWHFMLDRGEPIKKVWDMIPEGLDLLMVHGPMNGYLDTTPYDPGKHLGCEELRKRVGVVKPKVFASGHFHDSHGQIEKVWDDGSKTIIINAATCDENYDPTNPPIILEL